MGTAGRFLVVAGVVAVVFGSLLMALSRLGIGSLPGDFSFGRGSWRVYIPVGTSILLSIVLTIVLSLLARLR